MEAQKKTKLGLGTFDLIKGIAMLMIILAHMTEYYPIREIRAWRILEPILKVSISMNTFFFLTSGYAFRERSPLKTLKQTAKDFLVPYLWVFGFTVVLTPIVQYALTRDWHFAVNEMLGRFMGFLFGVPGIELHEIFGITTLPIWYAIYFLPSLFIALNVLNLILKVKSDVLQCLLVFLCISTGEMLTKLGFNYYCINIGLSAVIFPYIGYQFKKHDVIGRVYASKAYRWLFPVLLAVIATGLMAERYGIKFVEGSDDFILDVTVSICISTFLLFVSIPLGNLEWRIFEPIKLVGTYTYWIMCIHAVDMFAIVPLWRKWGERMQDHILWAFCIDFCGKLVEIIIVCCVLKWISKRIYRRKMKNALPVH